MKRFFVYILCNKRNGTLYTGVTSDLMRRVYEHKNDLADGFTRRYRVHNLVWYEEHETAESAIEREKNIKKWERRWKLQLIEKSNPEWNDLYRIICEDTGFPLKGLREWRPQEWCFSCFTGNMEHWSVLRGNDDLKNGAFRGYFTHTLTRRPLI